MPVQMPCDVISAITPVSWIYLRLTPDTPSNSYEATADIYYKKFAGREKPVPATANHKNKTFRAVYVSKTVEQPEAVEALLGKTVIIKTAKGKRMFGCVNRVGYDEESIYPFDLDITEIDYNEVVAYAD